MVVNPNNVRTDEIDNNLDLGIDFLETLSSGTKKGSIDRDGKDALKTKEAVESIFS